ncbi:MAG: serine hydrolase domain-containing protein [Candidatus Paceibacterota bacterium]
MSFETLSTQLKNLTDGKSGGVAAVVLDRGNSGFHFFGSSNINKDTIFEIGSVTKAFTALLLLILEDKGVVDRTDAVKNHLDIDFTDSKISEITLEQLALHTSGLPRLPTNFFPADEYDPYADYTKEDLYEFLETYELPAEHSKGKEIYSNTGFALLGYVLAVAAEDTFENLLQTHIFRPLSMEDTSCYLDEKKESRFAQGYNDEGGEADRWHNDVMMGDGAILSTTADMAKFLRMCCGVVESPLTQLVDDMCADYFEITDEVGVQQVLGWLIATPKDDGKLFVGKGGETGGFKAFFGFTFDKSRGIVLLSNGKFDISKAGAVYLATR